MSSLKARRPALLSPKFTTEDDEEGSSLREEDEAKDLEAMLRADDEHANIRVLLAVLRTSEEEEDIVKKERIHSYLSA